MSVTQQPVAESNAFVLPSNMKLKGSAPPGLEYLAQIDQVIIKQQVEVLEVLTGFETNNRYKIFNSMGQQIMYAQEETSCMMRYFCGHARGFTIRITDNNNVEVMRITREFKVFGGNCWCAAADACAFEVTIEAPVGTIIGYVRQICKLFGSWKHYSDAMEQVVNFLEAGSITLMPWNKRYCFAPILGVFDAGHNQLASVQGPICLCNLPCCGDVEFPVVTLDENAGQPTQVAMCSKQWSGMALEMFTDADTFSVRYPIDMDPTIKATLFGAMFLIDFMFFEKKND